ncbi:MAG: family 78 glycoside hydrolase catalytic domain [Clostridiaceae bacterium]|nr:family 78 glycoside hydrolase catalytic domain [Clostridiaceae bacterium]
MAFSSAAFIKTALPFEQNYQDRNPAPLFRRRFRLPAFRTASLAVCCLGAGYCWLNGRPVSQDLLAAPAGDYRRTLWYNVYDVAALLAPGDNVAALICGNSWYNETHPSPWHHNQAAWRDNPKFIFELTVDGQVVLSSNDSWLAKDQSPILFNQLRSGETYDARLADPDWNTLDCDESSWQPAIFDFTPPQGIFREYPCEPVRACAEYPAQSMQLTPDGRCIFDIGQNIAGFIRLRIQQAAGDRITIRYTEQLNPDLTLQLNHMDEFYPESPFQTDRLICDGSQLDWSPRFTYHGFRYIELSGVKNPDLSMVSGIFIHLDVPQTAGFECSDPVLNQLYQLGRMATLSNLQHVPTDCPTREKLGWANDAQSSAEQMMINFGTVRFFKKWLVDIQDSLREDGAVPGIIPTPAWGYEWGTGPVSSGVLFEVPYQIYLQTGDDQPLIQSLPYFRRHLAYLLSRAGDHGLIGFGLGDWAGPFDSLDSPPTPKELTDTVLTVKCLKIAVLAARRAGDLAAAAECEKEQSRLAVLLKAAYIKPDGTCTVHEQTAVAMLIVHGLYDHLAPLAAQLKQTVEEHDFHHYCGMVGLRHLYEALTLIGAPEYAYRIITARGYPSYTRWIEGGATTLWETWQPGNSKNHHMYSHFMAWLIRNLAGINPDPDMPGYARVLFSPVFLPDLDFCRGYCDTVHGRVAVDWQRINQAGSARIHLKISLPAGVTGVFRGQEFPAGEHEWDL